MKITSDDQTASIQQSAEDKLRLLLEDAEDLKCAIEESSIVGIADAVGAIHYSNHNFRKITHFDAIELESQKGQIVQEEFYAKGFVSSIWASVVGGKIWRGELNFRTNDDRIYRADTSIVPFIKDGHAYKYVVIKKDITARKHMEEQLRAAHQTLRLHVENTPLGFIEWDTKLNVRALSKRAGEIFGWSKDDLASNGTTAYAKLFKEVLPWVSKLAEQLLSGEASGHRMLHRNLTKDGRTITCEWFNSVVKDANGKIITIVSLVLDLTDKMKTEEQLLESEAFNRGVFNSLSSHVAVVNGKGEVIAVNASWDRFAQENGDSALNISGVGNNYFTACAKAAKQGDTLAAQTLRGMKDVLKGKEKELYMEYPCYSATEKRWFGMRALRFEMKEPMLVLAYHDISVLKLAEEDLLNTRQMLTEAQRMAKMGNWSFDPVANSLYWSEGMSAIYGLPPDTVLTNEISIEMIHPDDRQRVMDQMLNDRISGRELTLTFRILRMDNGGERTVKSVSDVEMDAQGHLVRLFGITEDVTEIEGIQAQLQSQLNDREKRAAELVIANAELAFQNQEKEARAAELAVANEELVYQNKENEARANELSDQHEEREKRAAELVIANAELAFQNQEKEARAAELAIANEELVYQNKEKEARANELSHQHEEREKRAAELVIANAELAFQNQEKEARAAELAIANEELLFQNQEKERRATELIATNKELKQAQFERDNALLILEQRVAERTAQLATKNKDVTDSINYAKRIQASLLSPFSQLEELFVKSFILHQPRNIVSGDFYWCLERGDHKYIVVADCTGHGVPGALMSIIGNDLLNEVIINDNFHNPSDILVQLDNRLKERMKGDHGEVLDGMDLALCVVDTTFQDLYFAGAIRPLFIADANGVVSELRGSRHCIGGASTEAEKRFKTHRMAYRAGLRIYLTSDGYHSQFGGANGKKFMKSRFKTLLGSVQHLSMLDQCLHLKEKLSDWKGDKEQVDDVLVVGIEL